MERVDSHPTHRHGDFALRPGDPLPFGASFVPGGVNFSVYSSGATSCTLILFKKGEPQPLAEIPFFHEFRIGNVWAMVVFDLDYENIEYGFRMDGPFNPKAGDRFNREKILLDPYAHAIGGRDVWGVQPNWNDIYQHRAHLVYDDFDWESDRPLEIPMQDLVIYEMHVRSFTQHPSSRLSSQRRRGTFAGIAEKIPYLKALGVNCIELLPIYEFDEFENSKPSPITGELLMNYWGYSTVGFFAPKAGYASTGKAWMQVDELKNLIKTLHRSGIEVFLDVVFNHTAEGNEMGPTISYRGIDNKTYYMLTPDGYYFNFSGTGNTLNCNNPIVRNMVLDCLRYWAAEYHIDGFRFDLAAILGRDPWGNPLSNPPLLETLAFDPILAKCKLIAEAWDAGGLYLVGAFPAYGRWAEWNGKYRDTVRKFIKGDEGQVTELALRLEGSPDLYASRGPTATINFITCHDGFTLNDLVSYNHKHNEANGENNNDGGDDNHSWNCGWEGETESEAVNWLRRRQMKNAAAMLMSSHGVPMILMGDEVGRTQKGNNNSYCQDNELNWMDWTLVEKNAELLNFFQKCIAFRHVHPVLRTAEHFRHQDYLNVGLPDASWHGTEPWQPDFSPESRVFAFMLCGKYAQGGATEDDDIYVALNAHWESRWFHLPPPSVGKQWHVFVNTAVNPPEDIWEPGSEPLLQDQSSFLVGPRSVVILVGK